MSNSSRYSISALSKGLAILRLFTQESPVLSLTDIVNATQMTKSTAFRVLSTLEDEGYLARDEARRYRPGVRVLELGFAALRGLDTLHVARPHLEQLARETSETVSLAVLDGEEIVYVDRVRNRAIVGLLFDIGSRAPAHCTGLGKALLAELEDSELSQILEHPLEEYTEYTITDPDDLRADLELARDRGYALNDQELAIGLRTIAAPIRRPLSQVAALGISGPVTSMTPERIESSLAPALLKTVQAIMEDLGAALAVRER